LNLKDTPNASAWGTFYSDVLVNYSTDADNLLALNFRKLQAGCRGYAWPFAYSRGFDVSRCLCPSPEPSPQRGRGKKAKRRRALRPFDRLRADKLTTSSHGSVLLELSYIRDDAEIASSPFDSLPSVVRSGLLAMTSILGGEGE
jgi:hypothetical protein